MTCQARVTYAAMYVDGLGRTVATANYGTNGGNELDQPEDVPNSSDTVLVSTVEFDATGSVLQSTDPSGMVTKFEYDDMGRETKKIMNYVESASSSSSSSGESSSSSGAEPCSDSDDTNVTVETSFDADAQLWKLTAINATTGDQTTEYVHGTTLTDSGIATSTLKRKEIYPDSEDADDVILFAYNRQGQAESMATHTRRSNLRTALRATHQTRHPAAPR